MLHAISAGYTLVHKIGGRKRKANKKKTDSRESVFFYVALCRELSVVEHHRHEEHEELFGLGLLGRNEYACS